MAAAYLPFPAQYYPNASGVQLDATKQLEMPQGCIEFYEGYQERWDSDGNNEIVRTYQVPWSLMGLFRQWALGYSFNTGLVLGSLITDQPGLSRIIPAQDPLNPWMYAVHCELDEPQGVPTTRNDVTVNNSGTVFPWDLGANATGPDLPSLSPPSRTVVPVLAYANRDNSTSAPQWGASTQFSGDGLAKMKVHFKSLPFEVRSDAMMAQTTVYTQGEMERYVERQPTMALKSFQIQPTQQLAFVWPGVPAAVQYVPSPGTMPFPVEELTYVWHDVPDVPYLAIDSCMGRINVGPFDGAYGYNQKAPGTCMLIGASRERTPRNCIGHVMWRIRYKFLYQSNGWNSFPNAYGAFLPATFGGAPPSDAVNVFKIPSNGLDFNALFKVPTPTFYQTPGYG